MGVYKVMPGRLLRHADYSVRGYSGDVIPDTDSAVLVHDDPLQDLAITTSGTSFTPNPGGGGSASNHLDSTAYYLPTVIPAINTSDRQIHVAANGSTTGNYGDVVGNGIRGDVDHPFSTIAYAAANLRTGTGDRLLLRRGDSFTGSLFPLALSGLSSSRPLIIGAYGTGARPIVDSTTTPFYQNSYQTPVAHIWFIGIEMKSSTYTGALGDQTKALTVTWTASDILVEDCYIHNYGFGIDFEAHDPGGNPNPRHTNLRIRGCVIEDIYVNSLATQSCSGIFAAGVDQLTIEQNVLISCGWTADTVAYASTFKHGIYVHAGNLTGDPASGCSDVVCKNNICIEADGFTIRPGGIITGNVLTRCMSGIQVGMGDTAQLGGIFFNLDDNVMTELESYDNAVVTIGLAVGNVGASSTCSRNIVSNTLRDQSLGDVHAVWFRHPTYLADGVTPCTNNVGAPLAFTQNIFYHGGNIAVPDASSYYTGHTTWTGNDFQLDDILGGPEAFRWDNSGVVATMSGSGNNFWQAGAHQLDELWYYRAGADDQDIDLLISDLGDTTATKGARAYTDSARSLETYGTSIGLAGLSGLKQALRERVASPMRSTLTANAIANYIRAGFGR